MSQCIHCSSNAIYNFRVLEVQTLHIRDITGERRVQALGLFQNYSICRSCAEAQLRLSTIFGWSLIKKILPFFFIFILGILVLYLNVHHDLVFFVFSFSAIFCGIVGMYAKISKFLSIKKIYNSLSNEEALKKSAWDCLILYAPKKDGDNDLTYIPIDEKTYTLTKKDFINLYDLLPAIAEKAWNMLHNTEIV